MGAEVDVNGAFPREFLAVAVVLLPGCCQPGPSPSPPLASMISTPVPEPSRAPSPQEALVAAAHGRVELQRGHGWAPVAVGDRVHVEDALRTAADGRADLEIGARSRIRVAENSQVEIAELTEAMHRFKLRHGRVGAAYEPDGQRVLRVEGESGDAVVEAQSAHFNALASPGAFAVSTETGSVNLRAAGAVVRIGPGEQSVAAQGRSPSPAATIPASLLLKVAAAGGGGSPCAALEGAASPGAELSVDGALAPTDAAGHFRVQPGAQKPEVHVAVRDASGRVEERRVRCGTSTAPAEARIKEMKIRWRE